MLGTGLTAREVPADMAGTRVVRVVVVVAPEWVLCVPGSLQIRVVETWPYWWCWLIGLGKSWLIRNETHRLCREVLARLVDGSRPALILVSMLRASL